MFKKTSRIWIVIVCAVVGGLAFLFVVARSFAAKFKPEVHARVVAYLEQRFESNVTLGDLQIQIPKVAPLGLLLRGGEGTVAHIEGRDLRLSHKENATGPPLFAVDSFSFDLDLGMLRKTQPHVPHVELRGMTITIPPKSSLPDESNASAKTAPKAEMGEQLGNNVVIDTVTITGARLVIVPKKPDAKPLDFALQTIQLKSAGLQQQLEYDATLTNPRPPGLIHSKGTFGPWNGKTPGDTRLEGDYDFSNADLAVFPAIAGILHSTGHFVGTLSAVRARGEATVPDFRLKTSGNRVPLETQFDVIVDGTNGNTILQPVHARLRSTRFQTSGGIIKHEANGRRSINLTVSMAQGHIEDLLLLAAKGKPFMSGLIRMGAKISIPPLSGTVKENLFLAGTFNIERGEFLHDVVQSKVDELSRRGQGRPNDHQVDDVFSSMTGSFRLEDQVLTFKRLSFEVPGAVVGLHGDYQMAKDTLDFHGDLKLKAKVSETLSGWKRWVAKPFDPFFAKNGAGTFLKIQVVGNAGKPEFGLDHGEPAR